MRLWTLHPQYLDARGLVALWREALLAQKVLLGRTKGYRNHPQLARFRAARDAQAAISCYLVGIVNEAQRRGYAFDSSKIGAARECAMIDATEGQLLYEWRHLKRKLRQRDPTRYKVYRSLKVPSSHPLFHIVAGRVEEWERR